MSVTVKRTRVKEYIGEFHVNRVIEIYVRCKHVKMKSS